MLKFYILLTFGSTLLFVAVTGQTKYCFSCRSRGKRGDCRDPFLFNSTHLVPGVQAVPCASGWCSKKIEGDPYGEDHDLATERRCMPRIPPDNNPRCSDALDNHKKVFICFCQGSLCNAGARHPPEALFGILTALFIKMAFYILSQV